MPSISSLLVLLAVFASASALNKNFPMPDPKFNVKNKEKCHYHRRKRTPSGFLTLHRRKYDWLGHWYMISRIIPCGWPGSSDFTDFQMFLCMEGKNVLTENAWRSEGFCSSTVARFAPVPGLNGAFTVRDQIGGTWSAEVRVVLLDHKTGIKINWGCVQREMPRFKGEPPRCKDAWVSVGSRHLQLSHYATLLAYQVLSTLGIRKSDLIPMVFTGKPCQFTNRVCSRPKFFK